jgi:hypothetical protein
VALTAAASQSDQLLLHFAAFIKMQPKDKPKTMELQFPQ